MVWEQCHPYSFFPLFISPPLNTLYMLSLSSESRQALNMLVSDNSEKHLYSKTNFNVGLLFELKLLLLCFFLMSTLFHLYIEYISFENMRNRYTIRQERENTNPKKPQSIQWFPMYNSTWINMNKWNLCWINYWGNGSDYRRSAGMWCHIMAKKNKSL